jgi:hypothetical protein
MGSAVVSFVSNFESLLLSTTMGSRTSLARQSGLIDGPSIYKKSRECVGNGCLVCLVADMKYEINQFLPVPLLLFPLVSLSTLPSTVSLFGKRSHHYLST